MARTDWLLAGALAVVSLGTAAGAQTQAQTPAPVVEPRQSPRPVEVNADRSVTFRIWAPRATAVGVSGDFAVPPAPDWYAMTKDAQGVWSVTLDPLPPNVWLYSFLVDGVQLPERFFEVPGDGPQFHDVRNVPHGTIHLTHYASKSLGVQRPAYVYTPPGYERGTARYPVLYLLHPSGRSGPQYWTKLGLMHVVLDNLIADGEARPMVVVMPFGYPQAQDRDDFPPRTEYSEDHERFATDLLQDLIPFVERTYRVVATPDHRAIAGASMGGLQALSIGLANVRHFHWVGAFSGLGGRANPPLESQFAALATNPAGANRAIRLLWFTAGEKETRVHARNAAFSRFLTERGVRHTFVSAPGWNHQPGLWRQGLRDFARLLFRR